MPEGAAVLNPGSPPSEMAAQAISLLDRFIPSATAPADKGPLCAHDRSATGVALLRKVICHC